MFYIHYTLYTLYTLYTYIYLVNELSIRPKYLMIYYCSHNIFSYLHVQNKNNFMRIFYS